MSKETLSQVELDTLWTEFEHVSDLPDETILSQFDRNGATFMLQVVSQFTLNTDEILIQDRNEYLEFTRTLRDNYRQWNQSLMSLILQIDFEKPKHAPDYLLSYIEDCHWQDLRAVAITIKQNLESQ